MVKGSVYGAGGTHLPRAEHGFSVLTAFASIRELIVHGRLAPGAWIVEDDLAERLGMSRTPVRGALQRLQREGYVLEQKGASKSRMFVAPLTRDDADELYAIIGGIEGLAGRNTALLPLILRQKIASELTDINEKLRAIAGDTGRSGAGGIFDLDRKFHKTIIASGAGPRLSALHAAIEPQAERYWRLYAGSIIDDLHLSIEEHTGVITSLLAGDADGIERGLRANWENGSRRLAQVIEMLGAGGRAGRARTAATAIADAKEAPGQVPVAE